MQPSYVFAVRHGARRLARVAATAASAAAVRSAPHLRCSASGSLRAASAAPGEFSARSCQPVALRVLQAATARAVPLATLRSCAVAAAVPVRASFLSSATLRMATPGGAAVMLAALHPQQQRRCYGGLAAATRVACSPKKSEGGQLQGVNNVERYRGEEEEEQKGGGGGGEQEDPFNMNSGPGYLPFPAPFHTINIVIIMFLANVICYFIMNFGNDDWRDFIVEHFTLSHENWTRVYPLFTNAFYQENLLQLLIDCWLLWKFGDTMLGFLGNTRMTFFAMLCTLGGGMIHVARQQFELYYGMDELEVRGRCYGPNPFIMGLVAIEGLIFRHLNFIQQPPIPFLVLTAFVMVIDVWRIFTTKPEEHGAATGGALMAYLFWALPTRMLGLDKLTATL